MRKVVTLVMLFLILSMPVYAASSADYDKSVGSGSSSATKATVYFPHVLYDSKSPGTVWRTGSESELHKIITDKKLGDNWKIEPITSAQAAVADKFGKSLNYNSNAFVSYGGAVIATKTQVTIYGQPWTGTLAGMTITNEKLYYRGKEVKPAVAEDLNEAGYLELFADGKGTSTYLIPTDTGMIEKRSDGSRTVVYESGGKLKRTYVDADAWAAGNFDANIKAVSSVASIFDQQGTQLTGAKHVPGVGYIATSAWRADDVIVSEDGSKMWKGDFKNEYISGTSKFDPNDPNAWAAAIETGSEAIYAYTDDNGNEIIAYKGEDSNGVTTFKHVLGGNLVRNEVILGRQGTLQITNPDGSTEEINTITLPDNTLLYQIPGTDKYVSSDDPTDISKGDIYNEDGTVTEGKEYDETVQSIDKEKLKQFTKQTQDHVNGVDAKKASDWSRLLGHWRQTWLSGVQGPFGIFGGIYNVLKDLLKGYQDYRGIAALGGLFMKDEIKEWRAKVDDLFCKAMLGADCVAQKMCEKYGDSDYGGTIITVTTPGTSIRAAAYIQAQRSQPTRISDDTGTYTEYLYRVTYYASSPDTENSAQLVFHSTGGTYAWYPEPQKISKGGSVSAQGSSAITQYSRKVYDTVCLELRAPIDNGIGGKESKVCVPIVDVSLTPSGENPQPPEPEETAAEDTPEVPHDEPAEEVEEEPGAGF